MWEAQQEEADEEFSGAYECMRRLQDLAETVGPLPPGRITEDLPGRDDPSLSAWRTPRAAPEPPGISIPGTLSKRAPVRVVPGTVERRTGVGSLDDYYAERTPFLVGDDGRTVYVGRPGAYHRDLEGEFGLAPDALPWGMVFGDTDLVGGEFEHTGAAEDVVEALRAHTGRPGLRLPSDAPADGPGDWSVTAGEEGDEVPEPELPARAPSLARLPELDRGQVEPSPFGERRPWAHDAVANVTYLGSPGELHDQLKVRVPGSAREHPTVWGSLWPGGDAAHHAHDVDGTWPDAWHRGGVPRGWLEHIGLSLGARIDALADPERGGGDPDAWWENPDLGAPSPPPRSV
jgi:hypothetical protein